MEGMPDNIDRYVPEFDEEEFRERLAEFGKEDLTDMLIRAYKQTREAIVQEPSALLKMPGVPGPDDLKRMTEDE